MITVKAIKNFDDYEGKEINENNKCKSRVVGEIFECSKERAEYLLEHKAIEIIKIQKVENVDKSVEKPKRKTRKKNEEQK